MAKSTFLELCKKVRMECGVAGNGPAAVTGQSGILEKIVSWTRDSDVETQGLWFDWDFLHVSSWSQATVIGEKDIAAPDDIGTWDEESFYLDYSAATHSQLSTLDYRAWRSQSRQGVKTNDRPDTVVIKPDLSLILEPPPDAVYSLTGDYWRRPQKMTANTDTSLIPEEYERIIVARAKIFYAEDQGATDILMSAQAEYTSLLDMLEAKYLPNQNGRRRADPGQMVVVPE